VMVARSEFHFAGTPPSDDYRNVRIVVRKPRQRDHIACRHQRAYAAPATRQINIGEDTLQQGLVGAIADADVGPIPSIWRPDSAPAAVVVVGINEGRADERKAMEAMMEETAPVSKREP